MTYILFMDIVIGRQAAKDLRSMPEKDAAAVLDKLEAYAASGVGDVVELKGQTGTFRLRHGDWRAIFEIVGHVLVLRVAHRREVYRRK